MLDPYVNGRRPADGSALSFAPERGALPPEIEHAYAAVLKAPPAKVSYAPYWNAWGSVYGGYNKTDGDAAAGTTSLTARAYGFAAGMDYRVSPSTLVGFALAGGGTNWGLAQGLGGGNSDAFQAGMYGKSVWGPAYVAGSLAFTNHWMTTDRYAYAGDHLTARFNAQSYGGRIESGYRIAAMPTIGVTPYGALQVQSFHAPSYSETDLSGGSYALTYAESDGTATRSELGARFDNVSLLGDGKVLRLRARAAWAHDWVSNPSLTPVFQTLPGSSFIVNGVAPAKNLALVSAGAELYVTPALSFAAKFDGEFSNISRSYAGTGIVRYVW